MLNYELGRSFKPIGHRLDPPELQILFAASGTNPDQARKLSSGR